MLGALSKCLANINSYRPQEMSKYKPGFPRVGKKGRDQIQQQNRELRVRGVTVTQRGALSRWWPCMLDAVCTQVRLRVIPRDPGDEEGAWAEQHQGYGDLASVGLPAAMFSPRGRMFISLSSSSHEEGNLPGLAGRMGASAAGSAVTFSAAWYRG